MSIEQAVLEQLRTLPINKQQEVLDFAEFLQTKVCHEKANHKKVAFPDTTEVSFLEAAREFIGCGESPEDLSTNPKYMEGYGQS